MSEYKPPRSDTDLEALFDQRRRGVSDPMRLAPIELQNITDVLLELLKQARMIASK